MVQMEELNIKGTGAMGTMLVAPGGEGHPNMIVVQCKKGYLMCGYLNLAAAEQFGDAAVLKNPIKGMTEAAKLAGVKEGMTGEEAAAVLNA